MRPPTLLMIAAFLVALTACAAPSSEVACAAALEFDGRGYTGHGEVTVLPPSIDVLGPGTVPPCDDGYGGEDAYTVTVRRLQGVDPATAVVVDGDIYVADGVETFPTEQLGRFFDTVRCSTEGAFVVEGQWIDVSAPPSEADGVLAPPYRMTVLVDTGRDGGQAYRRSFLAIRVTQATTSAPDREDVEAALWDAGTVVVGAHCEDGAFVADTVAATPPAR